MLENKIKKKLEQAFPQGHIELSGDGYHFAAIIVASEFLGKTKLKQQQLVYAALNDLIASGELHAISLKTFTPDDWQKSHKS